MKNDLIFLSTTCLSNFFPLSEKSDPFLLSLCIPQSEEERPIHNINPTIGKRIRAAEIILLEEYAMFEQERESEISSSDHHKSQNKEKSKEFRRVIPHQEKESKEKTENKENDEPVHKENPEEIQDNQSERRQSNQDEQENKDSEEIPQKPKSQIEKKPENLYEEFSQKNNIQKIEETILENLEKDKPKPKNAFQIRKIRQAQKEEIVQAENLKSSKEEIPRHETERMESLPNEEEMPHEEGEIRAIHLPANELHPFISEMILRSEEKMLETFTINLEEYVESLLQEPMVNFLGMKRHGKSILFVIRVDNHFMSYRRLIISAVLGAESSDLPSTLGSVIEYIWNNDPAVEIRVHLRHTLNEEVLCVCKPIQESFTNQGFKWKVMMNDENNEAGNRVTIFGIRRTLEGPQIPVSDLDKELLVFRASQMHTIDSLKISIQNSSPLFDLMVMKSSILSTLDHHSVETIPFTESISEVIEGLKSCNLQGFRNFQAQNKEDLVKFITDNDFNSLQSKVEASQQFPIYASLSSFSFRLNDYYLVNFMGKKCFHMKNEDSDIFTVSYSTFADTEIFIFPTDDDRYISFAFSADNFIADSKEMSIADYTRATLTARGESKPIDGLVIPTFKIEHEDNNETFQLAFQSKEYIDNGIIKEVSASDLSIIVLDSPFFFGVLNIDIAEYIDYPLFTTLVKDENVIYN